MKTALAWIGAAVVLWGHGDAAAAGRPVRSKNFVVYAPNERLAQEFAGLAERYRKEKAVEWLGEEMPPWRAPCPLVVKVTGQGAGGATTFSFEPGGITQRMEIEGELDKLRDSVLPHEVTHTVFANHFGRPVPRWADEGGSVLSENNVERRRHDQMCRQWLRSGGAMSLHRLFSLRDYPPGNEMMLVYAQGYSISRFLVDRGGRRKFLEFVAAGMGRGAGDWRWNEAAQLYGYQGVADLQQDWLGHLKDRESLAVHDRPPADTYGEAFEESLADEVTVEEYGGPAAPRLGPPASARGASPEYAEAGWSGPRRSETGGGPRLLAPGRLPTGR